MATATKKRKAPARKTPGPLKDTYQDMTDKVLALLDQGTVIWQQQWQGGRSDGGPRNLASKKLYRGINTFILNYARYEGHYSSSWWGTYKQILERGGQVRKGEKSVQIIWWNLLRKQDEVDGKLVNKTIPLLRTYNVFNVEQADWPEGSRRPAEPEVTEVDAIDAAEKLITNYLATGPSLRHGGEMAFYAPSQDRIQMPQRNDFVSADAYYSTLYHEATHSTGHSKRLARDGIADGTFGRFGDPVYSKEELVAEMGAAMLSGIAGIELNTIESSAAYLAHWRDVLKGDNKLIIQAAAQAQKAADLILGTTFDNEDDES